MASRKEREAEELRRRRRARQRFKTIVRIVAYNRTWLLDMEEQKLSLNVKKNIAMLVRPHRKIGILTLPEKSLLRTHQGLRTIKDRKHLVALFSRLPCFSTFPPRVRARLVPVMTFVDLQKNRTLIKEDAEPLMVYFILYGEVEVYKKVFNDLTQTYENILQRLLGTGDCIGEIEFIEHSKRRKSTYIASMDTEVLVLLKEDFERILQPLMSQQWFERKTAIKALQYFDFFNTDQLSAACKLSMLREFDPLETIYHEDKGLASYVYFVISGECMILQCLRIKIKSDAKVKNYELVNILRDDSSGIFDELTNKELMKILLEETKQSKLIFESDEHSVSNEEEKKLGIGIKLSHYRTVLPDIEVLCAAKDFGLKSQPKSTKNSIVGETFEQKKKDSSINESLQYEEAYEKSSDFFEEFEFDEYSCKKEEKDVEKPSKSELFSTRSTKYDHSEYKNVSESEKQNSSQELKEEILLENKHHLLPPKNSNLSENKLTKSYSGAESKPVIGNVSTDEANIKTENHFIDVGAMTFGGVFGLGEKIEHRVIMARTTVQCLLLPRFWLFEKEQNPGNMWQRRRFYLDHTIPSRQALFQNFLATMKWQKFKKNLISTKINTGMGTNPTKLEDIPIICRITEENN